MALRIAIVGQCADRVRASLMRSPRRTQAYDGQAYTLLLSESGAALDVDVPCTGGIELMTPIMLQHLLGVDAVVFAVYTGDAASADQTVALLRAMLEDLYHASTAKVLFLFDTWTAGAAPLGPACDLGAFDEFAAAAGSFHGSRRLVSTTDIEQALAEFGKRIADVRTCDAYCAYLESDVTPRDFSSPPSSGRSTSPGPQSARSTDSIDSTTRGSVVLSVPQKSLSGKQCALQ